MPRRCSVCQHKYRKDIDKMLLASVSYRTITDSYQLSRQALIRHKNAHIPQEIAQAERAKKGMDADGILNDLELYRKRTRMLSDAADRYLRDPENPESYTLEARSKDVDVIYDLIVEGNRVRKRDKLSVLLAQIESDPKDPRIVDKAQSRYADPRKLAVDFLKEGRAFTELIMRARGELTEHIKISTDDADLSVFINVLLEVNRDQPDRLRLIEEKLKEKEILYSSKN